MSENFVERQNAPSQSNWQRVRHTNT